MKLRPLLRCCQSIVCYYHQARKAPWLLLTRLYNAASTRDYEMEAEPQCSRRRCDWLGYVATA